MTTKLYDLDSHFTKFTATVESCEYDGKLYHVVLDKTAFFPESGGQESDIGTISNCTVNHVTIKDNTIFHHINKPLNIGQSVDCIVNWEWRFRNMQNHSGEHIISGIIHNTLGYDNVGFHLGNDMTADFNGPITKSQLSEIEDKANQAIWENIKFKTWYPPKDKLCSIDYRSKKELSDDIRLVEIPGYDICACCAPHVKYSGEIGLIKILDSFKYKSGIRLFIKCGKDALSDYKDKYENSLSITNLLSVKHSEISVAAKTLLNQNENLKHENSELKKRIIQQLANNITSIENKKANAVFEDGLDTKELQLFSDLLYKKFNGIQAIFSKQSEGYMFAICGEATDLDQFFKNFKTCFNVHGGGKSGMVQGVVFADNENLKKYFTNFN